METIAFKSTWRHAVLEYLIKEIDPNQDLSRSAITNRAIEVAQSVSDWGPVRENLMKLDRKDDVQTPISMQAKIDEEFVEAVKNIRKKISEDLRDFLERLQTPYFMQLLWMNYYNYLKDKKMTVGRTSTSTEDISGPDMVRILVQILLLNREADRLIIEQVKSALLGWEE